MSGLPAKEFCIVMVGSMRTVDVTEQSFYCTKLLKRFYAKTATSERVAVVHGLVL